MFRSDGGSKLFSRRGGKRGLIHAIQYLARNNQDASICLRFAVIGITRPRLPEPSSEVQRMKVKCAAHFARLPARMPYPLMNTFGQCHSRESPCAQPLNSLCARSQARSRGYDRG